MSWSCFICSGRADEVRLSVKSCSISAVRFKCCILRILILVLLCLN